MDLTPIEIVLSENDKAAILISPDSGLVVSEDGDVQELSVELNSKPQARARRPPRGHADSCPARRQESRQAMASAAMLVKLC